MTTKVNNTVNENVNEVMDERIVKLNELKSVKMAAISKGKRPAAKANKAASQFILENWDNEEALSKFVNDEESAINTYEPYCIAKSRIDELSVPAKEAEEPKAPKNALGSNKTARQRAEAQKKVTDKEIEETGGKREYMEEKTVDASQFIPSTANLKGVKLIITNVAKEMANKVINEDSITERLCETGKFSDKNIRKAAKDCMDIIKKAQDQARSSVKEEKKAPKEESKKEATKQPSSTKKVGDIHKNGKWVWTEYKTGKFDWRTIPTMKQKTGAKPKEEGEKKAESKPTAKKSDKTKKSNAKNGKKGETKKSSPEAPKLLTIEDFKAMPKAARGNAKPSKAQQEALKLIQKGYWIWNNGGSYFFKNEAGDSKSCNMESVKAMFKRYGIDYIPEGLVK